MSCECITWKYRSTSSFEAGESSPTCWATLPALQTKHTTTVIKKCFIDILRKSICRVADIPVGFQLLFTGWELPAVVGGELEFKSGGRNNRLLRASARAFSQTRGKPTKLAVAIPQVQN